MKIATYIILGILSVSCIGKSEMPVAIKKNTLVANLLNYQHTPTAAFDKTGLMFSDQGAWFAHGLPDNKNTFNGFTGPYLMTQQTGVSGAASLSQLTLRANSEPLLWDTTEKHGFHSHLNQKYTTKFYTKVPFQNMSADHPKFDPMNVSWRGPNWLDQAYFGIKGLRNYGFDKEADKATRKILSGVEGILDKGHSIRENYHPLSGKGLNVRNFSWSAAHLIMMLIDEEAHEK